MRVHMRARLRAGMGTPLTGESGSAASHQGRTGTLLGHKSIAMVQKHYAHLAPATLVTTIAKLPTLSALPPMPENTSRGTEQIEVVGLSGCVTGVSNRGGFPGTAGALARPAETGKQGGSVEKPRAVQCPGSELNQRHADFQARSRSSASTSHSLRNHIFIRSGPRSASGDSHAGNTSIDAAPRARRWSTTGKTCSIYDDRDAARFGRPRLPTFFLRRLPSTARRRGLLRW